MTWVLVILLQCGAWGCNHIQYVSYPDKESCYEAMDLFVKNHETKVLPSANKARARIRMV